MSLARAFGLRRSLAFVALGAVAAAPAHATDCLGPAGRATTPPEVVAAAETALRDPACAALRVDLEMLRALALRDMAKADGGSAWCAARDAFDPLRALADADYARTAGEAFAEADAACRALPPPEEAPQVGCPPVACPACPPPVEPASHWWFTGTGAGLAVVGAVLLGVGLDAHATAADLGEQIADEPISASGSGRRAREAELRAIGFSTGGGVLLGVGAALVVAGRFAAPAPREAGAASVGLGPSSVALTVWFD